MGEEWRRSGRGVEEEWERSGIGVEAEWEEVERSGGGVVEDMNQAKRTKP